MEELSSAGRWEWYPPPRNRRFYRHTFTRACELARGVVDTVVLNGRTWAQWHAHRVAVLDAEEAARHA